MSNGRGKKKKSKVNKTSNAVMNYSIEDCLFMMKDTSEIIGQENATRLSVMGPAASESATLTDSVEFWSWMNRNFEKSGHFSSSDSMQSLMNGTQNQQNWAKLQVQGKGYEWDWMSSQRKSFKNLFKTFDAGDVANRPGSDITVHDLISGVDKEQQLKAYTSKNAPNLKHTPKEMTVVTNAEKVDAVKKMGYEDVVSFGDNETIQAARDSRLEDMASGKASPNYTVKNVSATMAKAGMMGFVISASVETISSYKKWKSGKISTWNYLKEVMKSGGNAGVTGTFSAGIMIPITASVTTAGVSSLVTIPISFVTSAAVDKVVAPAFARGDYKKILVEANYYNSLTNFCVSLANTMEIASSQYVGFVGQMVSQQQRFSALAGNVISQQAIDDFEYYASLPMEEISVVITGMVSLLNDTDLKYDKLKDQNWFQRMIKTVTGKNKATKEDIKRNYEQLGVYVSKAVEVLFQKQCIDEKILVIFGEQIIALCNSNVSLNARLEAIESWKNAIDDSGLLVATPENGSEATSIKQLVDEQAQKKYDVALSMFLDGKLIDAYPHFKEAADNGVGRAYYYLGEYYYNGYAHIKEDNAIALEHWRKGMQLGDPLATYEYGQLKYADNDYQLRTWIRKHVQEVLRLAQEDDYAALYVYGNYVITDHKGEGIGPYLDSLADSLKFFKEAAKNGYWPAAFMFYQATEEIRKSGTMMPTYMNLFIEVEWYRAHQVYGMFEVLFGAEDYNECARHFQKALWLRDDKTEAAAFLAFILNTGLVEDSLADGFSRGNIPMYYEAGLKSEDEISLFYVGLLYFSGITKNGIREIKDEGIGKNPKKSFDYFCRCNAIFEEKKKHKKIVIPLFYGLCAGLLGFLYFTGEDGVPEDNEKAFKFLSIGHEVGDPQSTYLLAACYKEGIGVTQDVEKANQLMDELKSSQLPGVEMFKLP